MNFNTEDIFFSIDENNKKLSDETRYIVELYNNKINSKGKKGNLITVFDKLTHKFIFRVFCSNNKTLNNLNYIRDNYGKLRCKFTDEVESKYFNVKRTKSSDIN